jgi:hypothetical protein
MLLIKVQSLVDFNGATGEDKMPLVKLIKLLNNVRPHQLFLNYFFFRINF